jgi:CDP-paratose 2-epimerase
MSCIYGPHQFGTEDQGWVAHFLIQAMKRQQLTLYGDGLQVRDILFVDDLVDAMLLAHRNIHRISGEAFNIGGGPSRTVSLLELLELIGDMLGERPAVTLEPWRPADQRYYVSDTAKFERATGWRPRTPVDAGVADLLEWLTASGTASAPGVVGARVAS